MRVAQTMQRLEVTTLTILRPQTNELNGGMTSRSMASSFRNPKHLLMKAEELCLVDCLVDLVNAEGWRSDNETFRPGYLAQWVRITRGEDAKIQFNIDCYYLNKSEGVQPKDRLGMEFPTMYCPKMNMSPEDMMGHSTW
ncbi:retrotransposon protein [Cucumis melo var. makuwa]|uniref:Retrotransposon protein n=1 Tax=Cucumis melo var. makuwa TaxID=1194695 RepID=A0A5D3BEI9_CUCMM|nr:retrotransposon protein [Cucumis melo var. makuwa]